MDTAPVLLAESVSLSRSEMALILFVLALIVIVPIAVNVAGAVFGFRYARTGSGGAQAGWLSVLALDLAGPLLTALGNRSAAPLLLAVLAAALPLGGYALGRLTRPGPPAG